MNKQKAYFGGGCFWCTEAIFQNLKGIISVMPGYAGGKTTNPTYKQVCSGLTGHAEVIAIEYDNDIIDYKTLLKIFFTTHDPTTLNRQGNDSGTQYRSIILYQNESEKNHAEEIIKWFNRQKIYNSLIITELKPLTEFYPAENYHHNYYKNNSDKPYCQVVISPKLAKLKKEFNNLLK